MFLSLSTSLLLVACVGNVKTPPSGAGNDAGVEPGESEELVGAGDRELLADWPSIDIPFSQNAKMLNFEQLRNEVKRATTLSWIEVDIDQWDSYRSILGGADFVENWRFDTTPNQQKILTIRRMAFTVCGNLVSAEAGQATRVVFSDVDPAQAIDIGAPVTTTQVSALYKRFFYEDASAEGIADSLSLLGDLQTSEDQQEAWRGLCTAYLGSMRFLSY